MINYLLKKIDKYRNLCYNEKNYPEGLVRGTVFD